MMDEIECLKSDRWEGEREKRKMEERVRSESEIEEEKEGKKEKWGEKGKRGGGRMIR